MPLFHCLAAVSLLGLLSAAGGAQSSLRVRDDAVGCIRLRAAPRSDAIERGCVYAGAELRQLATAPYWRQVVTAANAQLAGWVPKKFIVEQAGAPSTETTIREDAWLEIHFVDVGQGDAIWIRTFDDGVAGNGRYDGRNVVIDGGPDGSDGSNQLLRYIFARAHEGAVIDALIITHPHDDHYPGAAGILRHFDVREYFEPGFPKTGIKWDNFRTVVDAEQVGGQPMRQRIGLAAFGTPDWGSEMLVRFLHAWPGAGQDADLGSDSNLENNASIVIKLTYGAHSFLFMGDAEGKERDDAADQPRFVENRLLANPGPAALRSTVLKVAHHGSETSSTLPFIRAVNPEYLVVTSGRRSFRGTFLPDRSTLGRYCANNPNLRIVRTDQDDEAEGRGAADDADADHVVIRTNGRTMIVQAFSAGQPITATTCQP